MDKAPLRRFGDRGDELTIPLPSAESSRHTVEVRYFEPGESSVSAVDWRPARLEGETDWVESYWEVVLPSDRHLLAAPEGFAPAMRWGIGGGRWRLDAAIASRELESWIGAVERKPPPPSQSRLLFSAYLPSSLNGESSVATISWPALVTCCSAAFLSIGLAVVYLPVARRPATLFVLSVVVLCLGLLYPGVMLFVAQTGLVGLMLAGLAAVLAILLQRPGLGDMSVSTSSLAPGHPASGVDTRMTVPLGPVSTTAPTVSAPPADSAG